MTSQTHILAIDDSKISQKVIAKSLTDDSLKLSFADDGEQGLALANELHPNIILLDVEMPGMNGFEVCEKLHNDPTTSSIPVIFLSSNSSLRERMQGYQVGAEDYMVKPFEKENLIAKIQVLTRYQEEKNALKSQFEQAQKTAMIAMTGSSELGIAMKFIENSYGFNSFDSLTDGIMQLTQQFQLITAVMIVDQGQYRWFASGDALKPIEKEMVELCDRNQRFIDFGTTTIVNYPNLSLMVKNMPLDDLERYGRLKDLLPAILSAADAKINTIWAEQAVTAQSEVLIQSFSMIRNRLYYLASELIENQQNSSEQLHRMVQDLHSDLLRLGLDDDQENHVLNQIDQAIDEIKVELDSSGLLYQTFSAVWQTLKQISQQNQQLVEALESMNRVEEVAEMTEDDSIEFF